VNHAALGVKNITQHHIPLPSNLPVCTGSEKVQFAFTIGRPRQHKTDGKNCQK
jgi:hypothetical protein